MPEFRLSRLQRKAQGGRLYQCEPSADLIVFILLIINDNADSFNLDAGFSRNGSCPEESFFLSPNDTLTMSSVLFRLPEFLENGKDPWWTIEEYVPYIEEKARFERMGTTALQPEEYLPRIDALIVDAVNKLQQYAVPFFAVLTPLT